MGKSSPKLPEPKPITVDVRKTALLVLDGSQRWSNPEQPCHKLVPGMAKFLERAREVGIPIIYSISARSKGTPGGEVCSALNRRLSEPVIYPDGFDKFTNGELQGFLKLYDVDTLIITGYRSNISVLNTATKATRELKYKVIIPIDGMAAKTEYEQEYTLFHFTVLPDQAAKLFSFTMLDMIEFH
ncbi:MAG: isochorismatase family protein [Thermodesulfobacteriota bacterium]|nr:isochorismatase family protein [Thermodesulfobacteriota bacterium]